MERSAWLALGAVGVVLSGCAAPSPPAGWTATPVTTIEGLNVPESVAVDPASGLVFISNIVAAQEGEGVDRFWADDGTGFIAYLKSAGDQDLGRWQESRPEAPLNAPKGLCIHEGWLWVADNSRIVRYPLSGQGTPERIEVSGAQRLNDAATDGRGVCFSDTATGKVYRIVPGGPEVIRAPEGVNGITFWGGKMFAVSWTLHEVYELDPSGRAEPRPFGLAAQFQNLDGIEVLDDGTLVVSDFTGGRVCTVSADRRTVRTLLRVQSPADIGLDRKRGLLFVPVFQKDRVAVYRLERK